MAAPLRMPDNYATEPPACSADSPTMTHPYKAEIELLLIERHPSMVVEVLGTAAIKIWGDGKEPPELQAFRAAIETERQQLMAMPIHQLTALINSFKLRESQSRKVRDAKKQADANAKAAAQEAARFYNLPRAQADLEYWCKFDQWTVEEATALLLGKDPLAVNVAALDRERAQTLAFIVGS
eukprot:gene7686-9515_t